MLAAKVSSKPSLALKKLLPQKEYAMNRIVVFITAIISLVFTSVGYSQHVIDESKKPQFLSVMSAKSGSFDGKTVTLNDVPTVIYFSDRPNRIAGHLGLKKFVAGWAKGVDSFKVDPPNATLSIFDIKGNKDAVIEISAPKLKGTSITFKVRLLEGKIPESFGNSSLFIDDYRSQQLEDYRNRLKS